MTNIISCLDELDRLRDKLANILTEKGIPSSESEKYNSLVEKVETLGKSKSKAEIAILFSLHTPPSIVGDATVAEKVIVSK